MSYEHVMRKYGLAVGRRPRIIRVPALTPTLSAYWLGLVTDWYALVPAHLFIFRAMTKAMLRRAAQIDAQHASGR
jgi:hypothetical protein